jgi:hypothetical protein
MSQNEMFSVFIDEQNGVDVSTDYFRLFDANPDLFVHNFRLHQSVESSLKKDRFLAFDVSSSVMEKVYVSESYDQHHLKSKKSRIAQYFQTFFPSFSHKYRGFSTGSGSGVLVGNAWKFGIFYLGVSCAFVSYIALLQGRSEGISLLSSTTQQQVYSMNFDNPYIAAHHEEISENRVNGDFLDVHNNDNI